MLRVYMVGLALLALSGTPAGAAELRVDELRDVLVEAVLERVGGDDVSVDIEVLQAPDVVPAGLSAMPAPGARTGQPVRFVITPASGPRFTVVARVAVVMRHAVASRALPRDAVIGEEAIEWRVGPVDGVLLEPLPGIDDLMASRSRRAIAEGEVLNAAALVRPFAVRAGDTVTMTLRNGSIVVRGVGRAVSSGHVGDLVRVMPPGTRQPSQARVIGPASVEIVQ